MLSRPASASTITSAAIENARHAGKTVWLSDKQPVRGMGRLLARVNGGSVRFYFRYSQDGVRGTIPIGAYSRERGDGLLTLMEARKRAAQLRTRLLEQSLSSALDSGAIGSQASEALHLCSGCGKLKRSDEFSWKNKAAGIRHSRCKLCASRASKTHYQANRPAHIARTKSRNEEYRIRNRAIVLSYVAARSCADCGVTSKQRQLFPYSTSGEAPPWQMVSRAGSVASVLAALHAAVILCRRCLDVRRSANNAWLNMTHEERDKAKGVACRDD